MGNIQRVKAAYIVTRFVSEPNEGPRGKASKVLTVLATTDTNTYSREQRPTI